MSDQTHSKAKKTNSSESVQIRDRIRELRRVPASALAANPKNWRRHPDDQKKAMRAVLEEIGYAGALLAREDTDGKLILIDGHLRADTTPTEIVPVLVLDVTEAESDKILATFDPLAAMAEPDLTAWGSLLDGVTWDVPEFGELLQEWHPEVQTGGGLTDENDAPALVKEPVSQRGDLYLLGAHRLLCGDSTNATDVFKLLNGVKPGLMTSDPPFGVSYDPGWRNEAARAGKIAFAARREGKVPNDDRADWAEAYALFPGTIAYIWHASLFGKSVQESLERCDFELRSQIIWAKSRFAISRGHYHWQHESCFYAVKKGANGNWQGDRSQTTLWQIQTVAGDEAKNDHGTQKPVECMRRPILNHTNRAESVYDPFVGSGTTIIAAETCGRVAYVMELAPTYVDCIVKRWESFTGKTAEHEDGRTFAEIAAARKMK